MDTPGLYSTSQLRHQGLTLHDIRRLVHQGSLTRIARGWYASEVADPTVQRAIKAGGRLGCLSGCGFYGLWVPPHPGTHVVSGHGSRPTGGPGLIMHVEAKPQPPTAVWPLIDCLRQMARRHSREDAMIVAESAVNLALATPEDARWALRELPARHSALPDKLAPAQSGSETRVRMFFESRRIPVTAQRYIQGVGYVDLLVGDTLVVECDSHAHHGQTNYENDRRRDLAARDLGYTTIRLSYQQIWMHWAATQQSLLREIRNRKHLRRRT